MTSHAQLLQRANYSQIEMTFSNGVLLTTSLTLSNRQNPSKELQTGLVCLN